MNPDTAPATQKVLGLQAKEEPRRSGALRHQADPQTSVAGGILLAQAFADAGLPNGVLHVLPGTAEAREALVIDQDIQVILIHGDRRRVRKRFGELGGRF